MSLFLGIDAGGSATRCVVGDEHRILGRAQTSSCKIQRVGEAEARRALHAVIREACQSAGVAPGGIEQACIGISGASHPEVVERVRHIMGEVISAPVEVLGDIIIALDDHAINNSQDLDKVLQEHYSVGQEVTVTVRRRGQEMKIKLTLTADMR